MAFLPIHAGLFPESRFTCFRHPISHLFLLLLGHRALPLPPQINSRATGCKKQ